MRSHLTAIAILLASVLAMLATGPLVSGKASAGAPPGMSLAFEDDFNSFNALTWDTCYPWWPLNGSGCTNLGNSNEIQWNLPSQVSASNGALHLVATKQDTSGTDKSGATKVYPWRSGMVTTYHSFSFTYGYVEVSARIPKGDGFWPALWLLPNTMAWPPEIDIMENWGNDTLGNSCTMHLVDLPPSQGQRHSATDLSTGWHTFAVDWTPSSITCYFDGTAYYTYTGSNIPHEPMYFLATLAVNGDIVSPATPATGSFDIDRVSIYKAAPTSSTPTTTTQPSKKAPRRASPVSAVRIAGNDAIDTAVASSRGQFPADQSARSVVLARSDHFADALAGGPLAAAGGGPLLITPGGPNAGIDDRVLAEIRRVLPRGGPVHVLGGPLALGVGVVDALRAAGYTVDRIGGDNQYATAVSIAERLGSPPTVFEATGLDFPDALSAVPAAVASRGAILLTQGATQAPETAAYLAAHPSVTRYAIGGSLAAGGADPGAIRVAGDDLYATSAAVADAFFARATTCGVATGANFPDALTGGVFMATGGRAGPMLLANPTPPVAGRIVDLLAAFPGDACWVFGGPLAVSDATVAALGLTAG